MTEENSTERVLTGGITDIRPELSRALLLRVESEETADSNKWAEITRDFLIETFGQPPITMPPSRVSGFVDFRIEGLYELNLEETLEGLASTLANREIGRSGDIRFTNRKLAQRLSTPGRQRENRDADGFSASEVTALLDEIEKDYGELVNKLSGSSFVRSDSLVSSHWTEPTLLSLNWATRYVDEEINKEATVNFSIAGERVMRRIEERVEVPLGTFGRLFGKKPTLTTRTRSEQTDELNLHVSLVSKDFVRVLRRKEVGRLISGGLHDFGEAISDNTRIGGNNKVDLDELITPRTLKSLDPVMRKVLRVLEKKTGWTYGKP